MKDGEKETHREAIRYETTLEKQNNPCIVSNLRVTKGKKIENEKVLGKEDEKVNSKSRDMLVTSNGKETPKNKKETSENMEETSKNKKETSENMEEIYKNYYIEQNKDKKIVQLGKEFNEYINQDKFYKAYKQFLKSNPEGEDERWKTLSRFSNDVRKMERRVKNLKDIEITEYMEKMEGLGHRYGVNSYIVQIEEEQKDRKKKNVEMKFKHFTIEMGKEGLEIETMKNKIYTELGEMGKVTSMTFTHKNKLLFIISLEGMMGITVKDLWEKLDLKRITQLNPQIRTLNIKQIELESYIEFVTYDMRNEYILKSGETDVEWGEIRSILKYKNQTNKVRASFKKHMQIERGK